DQPIINALPAIDEYLCEECRSHFEAVQRFLQLSGIQYTRDKRLVRGFDYYTRTAFEVTVPGLGAQNSVAGGGRYDGLVEELGGKPTKAIGFALGLDRLVLALPEGASPPAGVRVYIIAAGAPKFDYAYQKVQLPCRRAGIASDLDYQQRSLKAALRQADKKGVEWTAIVGEDELKEGQVSLKNMKTGEQTRCTVEEAIRKLR